MRDALLLLFILACLAVAIRYPFAGVITWAWFSLMTPQHMTYGVYGLPLNVIIAGATIAAIAFSGSWRSFRFDATTGWLAALLVWLTLSQLFSLDAENSFTYYDRFAKVLIFILICVQMTTDKLRFHALVWMLTIAIGYFAFKGALFTAATLGQYRVQGLVGSVLEDNNHMGIAIATILPMMLYLRAQTSRPLVRTGLGVLFVLSVFAIIGTHSRGAFVSLVVFAGFFWLRSRHKIALLAGLLAVLAPTIAFMPAKWKERMETITEAKEDASFMGRVDAWVINAKLAAEHPLTGAGLRNSYQPDIARRVDPERADSAKAAHSVYFELLGGAGFVGLGIYLSLLATALLQAMRLQRGGAGDSQPPWTKSFGYHAQIALVVFAVGGATVSLEMWDGYLIVIALIAAAARMAAQGAEASASRSPQRRQTWRMLARGRLRAPVSRPAR